MAWLAISLEAEADVAEVLSDALMDVGAVSVSCDDADAGTAGESAQFAEPGLAPPRMWRRNILTALIDPGIDPGDLVAAAAGACGLSVPAFTVSPVKDEDWVRNTQMQFEPIEAAPRIWIVPSWCTAPEEHAINIAIDPGLAFGTGSHATTRLVIRWMAQWLKPGETLLDYGCGSGILAIVAARLGAGQVTGIDIDPQALIAAEQNAAKNGIAVRLGLPDALPAQRFDIVVANILANPLIVLEPVIASYCDNRIALSGILEAQAGDVVAAYSQDFDLSVHDTEDGWVLLAGRRK